MTFDSNNPAMSTVISIKDGTKGLVLNKYKLAYTNLTANREEEWYYKDNPSPLGYCNNQVLTDFKLTTVNLTNDQQTRLDYLNNDMVFLGNLFYNPEILQDVHRFILYGYVNINKEYWLNLKAQYDKLSRDYLVYKFSQCLSNYKDIKEVSGVNIQGMYIKTDKDTQIKITGLNIAFTNKYIKETKFKDAEGNWITVDFEKIQQINKAVLSHVQNCFLAEVSAVSKLTGMTLEQLQDLTIEGYKDITLIDYDQGYNYERNPLLCKEPILLDVSTSDVDNSYYDKIEKLYNDEYNKTLNLVLATNTTNS